MTLASKLKTGTAIAILGILAIWYGVPGATRSFTDDDDYVASVTWRPEVLSIQRPVNIRLSVDGVPLVHKKLHVSPWSQTMTAAPGAQITLSADTVHPSVFRLDCMIMRNGRSVPRTGVDVSEGPGAVTCTA